MKTPRINGRWTRMVPFLGIAAFFLLWFVVTSLGWVSSVFVPSLSLVFETVAQKLVFSAEWWPDVFQTLWRSVASLIVGGTVGLVVGVLLGAFNFLYQALEGLLDFFRAIPATALFPLFVLVLGIGDAAKIAAAVWVVALLVTVNTSYGIRHANKTRLKAARILKPSFSQYWLVIVLPEAASQVASGLRIGLNFALVVVVVTEMFIGTTAGLGFRIFNAQLTYTVNEMYAAILILGVLGYLLNRLFVEVERRVVHWAGN